MRPSSDPGGARRGTMVARQLTMGLALAGPLLAVGCWLDRGVVDLPTLKDAGPPPEGGPGGCRWVASSGASCALTEVSCNQLTACPASWTVARSPESCPRADTGVRTETCEGMYRWSLFQGASPFGPSGNGTLVAVCYYDVSTGLLAGIDSQSQLPCGANPFQFGTVPPWCHHDAGVADQQFDCAGAGSGMLSDAGASRSCSREMPCGGGG